MYQLGLLYGSDRHWMSPEPLPTRYGGSSPQANVSFISRGSGIFASIPLNPEHSYVPGVTGFGGDGVGVGLGVATAGGVTTLGLGDPGTVAETLRSRSPGISTVTAPANATAHTTRQTSASPIVFLARVLRRGNAPPHPTVQA
jgi:hypothetical protein